ncbi:DUF2243 domain-containing protein [Candidatus Phyllobacterium onerii]|uniref:DUF2243 domain-containing protein n=1 Tax=Candidatus Phyllobacterium onerii TaxID=3020828 RepID=UPI00232EFE8C|nr:DUF2243 domain-containing protein [Phyllobacterium sp. IY22]
MNTSMRQAKDKNQASEQEPKAFPVLGGILLGLGLGGFFDGIVLHQILQWHHIATSAGYPANSVENLEFNTMLDGVFHAGTYVFTVSGLIVLWNTARKRHFQWSAAELLATMLIGFGLFNLIEGFVDHHLLGLHHVNETVRHEFWVYWDFGFLVWGAVHAAYGIGTFTKRPISSITAAP